MSAKPSTVPLWNTAGTNNTTPSGGQISSGWTVGQIPPSSYFNNRMKLYGEWIAWLDDGDVSFHNLSTVSGGTLTVAGATTLNAALTVNANGSVTGTFSATGLITATAGVTCGTNAHVTVSGTGDYKHGDMEIVVAAPAWNQTTGNTYGVPLLGDDWAGFGLPPNDMIRAAVQGLRKGDRIKSITWHFNKAGSSTTLIMKLRVRNGTTNTDVDTLNDVSTGGSYTSVTRSFTYTLVAGDAPTLTVAIGGTPTGLRFSHAVIIYDHP